MKKRKKKAVAVVVCVEKWVIIEFRAENLIDENGKNNNSRIENIPREISNTKMG